MTPQQQTILQPNQRVLTVPLMYLSSENQGWNDLTVQAYHEPMTINRWKGEVLPDVSLVMMTRGAMLLEARQSDGSWRGISIQQGDLFLRPAGSTPREIRWNSITSEPMQTLHIHLKNEVLRRTAATLNSTSAGIDLMGQSGFQDPLLAQIGYALWQELENPSSVSKLYAQTAAQMMAVHLLRHYASPTRAIKESQAGLSRKQVRRINDYVEAHLSDSLSLGELAGVVGFSDYHFARLFRHATGHSPHQYVLRKRVERARYLLTHTTRSISEIAIETGFTHQSHMTHVFKLHVGMTPKTYRQNA